MRTLKSIISITILFLLNIMVYSQNPGEFKNDAEARELYDSFINKFKNLSTLSYSSHCSAKNSEGFSFEPFEYTLTLKKPNYAYWEIIHNGLVTGIMVGDGEYHWFYWPSKFGRPFGPGDENPEVRKRTGEYSYAKLNAPYGGHSIAHETKYFGILMLVTEPSYFSGGGESVAPFIDGVRFLSPEKIDGEDCLVIEVSYFKNQRIRTFWLSKSDNFPRKLQEIVKAGRSIIKEEKWSNIKFNQSIPDNRFFWKPPKDWTEWKIPGLESTILPGGVKAPEFNLKTLAGSDFKISDYAGKVIILNFWRAGCPPCRVEMPVLQKIHEKYSNKGVVVLGFNYADELNIAIRFLKEHGITFQNIVNNKEGEAIFLKKYCNVSGNSAVPMTYIIDKDGRIFTGWTGYSDDDPRVVQTLKNLGIE